MYNIIINNNIKYNAVFCISNRNSNDNNNNNNNKNHSSVIIIDKLE